MNELTEQQKVQKIYDLIGEKGLYVNTNHDVLPSNAEQVPLTTAYSLPLVQKGTKAYTSPMLFAALTSLLNHGTMLITGAPGIGKTTGAEFAGHFFTGTPLEDILAAEIQGHPQLTEEKMVASYDVGLLMQGKRKVIPRKFLKCPVKILDECNRTPPDVLSIIMRLVDTGHAAYGNRVLRAAPGPLFATANYADEGTFQLTPPFLDRFDVAVMVTSPPECDLRAIRKRGDEKLNGDLAERLRISDDIKLDFNKIRDQIKELPEAIEHDYGLVSSFADFLYGTLRFSEAASDNLPRATKGNAWQVTQDNMPEGHFSNETSAYTINELSVRTARAMHRFAKAYAWFQGKDKVELEDLKAVLPYLLWHKIQPSKKALTDHQKFANDRIAFAQDLIARVENDYTEMRGSDALIAHAAAMKVLKTGRIEDQKLTEDQIRRVVRNSIQTIGNSDKPWALVLAQHVASQYNERMGGVT